MSATTGTTTKMLMRKPGTQKNVQSQIPVSPKGTYYVLKYQIKRSGTIKIILVLHKN